MKSKKEPPSAYLRRRLAEFEGQHNRIAVESGVPQSTVSRIHLGQCSPRLETVEPLLAWFDKEDAKGARKPRSGQAAGHKKPRAVLQRAPRRAAAAPLGQ